MSWGGDFDFDIQRIAIRHEQHNLLARIDHAADGMHGKLVNDGLCGARMSMRFN